MENISGKVIKIINEYKIVINLGFDDVSEGDVVYVIDNSVEISDPESGKLLGSYTFKKEKMIIEEVFENFSICSPTKTKVVQNNLISAMNPLMNSPKEVPIPFLVEDVENEKIYLNEKSIKIGDVVIIN